MEQIYYTQCPIGYGLGASNGYQVKRITPGYPVAGDFRHLGLRAFPGGGRTLAPATLRYRRDGDAAEVALLTPRPQEYQTERGLWGRPGGVFAHGVRLDAEELATLGNWPAGWFDAPGWRTADPEPTRGRPPDDLDAAALPAARPAEFEAAALFDGEDPDWLARLWTALATVTREGRTLFLVDEPGRLAQSVAALTFAFPSVLRCDLTFSTFHDRPEELPGYRISGTTPSSRPNRMALLAQGVVADRASGAIEPPVEPAEWAASLAEWFTRRSDLDAADWAATEARAKVARRADDPAERVWSDDWLNPLVAFPAAYRDRTRPASAAGWARLGGIARWSGRAGSGEEWLRHRGPAWWLDRAAEAAEQEDAPAARAAFLDHARLREAWRSTEGAAGWGRAASAWFAPADRAGRDDAAALLFRAAPRAARPAFAQALIRGLGPDAAASVLARLRAEPGADRAMLLPLEVGIASARLAAALARVESDPMGPRDAADALRRLVAEAVALPGAVAATLDAAAASAEGHPEARPALAAAVAPAFDRDGPDEGRVALGWALRRDDAAAWLAPALRPMLADPGAGEVFDALRAGVPVDLHPRLARAALAVADDPGLPDAAFRLAVERLLLPLAPRPHHPAWAEGYLRRTPSTWDLFRRLYSKESAALGVPAWIDQARARGELSEGQAARVDSVRAFARSLAGGDPRALVEAPIPTGTPGDRGQFLRQMLGRLGGDDSGLPFVLDACRAAWPGAFGPGADGLRLLARPLVDRLGPPEPTPRAWLRRALATLDRLGLLDDGGGFEPDGLLAELVAALPPGPNPWTLRQYLFEDDRAWPTLALAVRDDVAASPVDAAADRVDAWDDKLVKATEARVGRFWELILNAVDPARRAGVVAERAGDLRSLGPLRWWGHAGHPGAVDDLRDAYARTAPLDPLPTGRLAAVESWLLDAPRRTLDPDEPIPMEEAAAGPARLSPNGLDRWRCLRALTEYGPAAPAPSSAREAAFARWRDGLPLGRLARADAYRFAAWAILAVDPADSQLIDVDRLAGWLVEVGVMDPRRVRDWADELAPFEVPDADRLARARFVGALGGEIRRLVEGARRAGPR